MSIEKDQTNEKNNNIRKSIRQQEKNIVKFLDSLSSKQQSEFFCVKINNLNALVIFTLNKF